MEALTAIQDLRRIALPILDKAADRTLFPVHFTFRLVLERLESSLGSLELLLQNDAQRHDHAAGLICRNILSDALATGYIVKLSTSEEELHQNLYALYHEDLVRTDAFVNLFKKAGIMTEDAAKCYSEKHAMPDSMYNMIRDYAEEYNTERFPGSQEIIRRLLAFQKEDPWSKELQLAFDIWTYYSKYEHLGWHAYELTRSLDRKKANARLRSAMRLAALLQSSCLEMLGQKEALEESMLVYEQLFPVATNTLVAND